MAVNRFNTPVESEYISLYVPIPFEQLYALGKEYNTRLDKAYEQMAGHIEKYKDFQSPSAVDTARWNEIILKNVIDRVNKLISNPDALKTQAGRAEVQNIINSMPYGEMNELKQSRDAMLLRQKLEQLLSLAGKYNPLWHGMDYTNYSTDKSGVFNDLNLVPYKSEVELVKPYLDNLEDSYLFSKDGYDYSGVSGEMTDALLDRNISAIYNTPEAQMHIKALINQGLTEEEANTVFIDSIYRAGREFARVTRTANPYSLLNEKNKDKNKLEVPPTTTNRVDMMYYDSLKKVEDIYRNMVPTRTEKVNEKGEKEVVETYNPFAEKALTSKNPVEQMNASQALLMFESMKKAFINSDIPADDNALTNLSEKLKKEQESYYDNGDQGAVPSTLSDYVKIYNKMFDKAVDGLMFNNDGYSEEDLIRIFGSNKTLFGKNLITPKQFVLTNPQMSKFIRKSGIGVNPIKMATHDPFQLGSRPIDVEKEIVDNSPLAIPVSVNGGWVLVMPDGSQQVLWKTSVKFPISELPSEPGAIFSMDKDELLENMGYTVTEEDGVKYVYTDILVGEPLTEQTKFKINMSTERSLGTTDSQKAVRSMHDVDAYLTDKTHRVTN